ncbi:MAG: type IV pilin protein [Psychromonas sp.]
MKIKGFTLTELLIVIAIIGILVAIVLPSYQEHIRSSNRVVAKLSLTKLAQEFERTNARQGSYPSSFSSLDTDTYTFSLAVSTNDTFTITATPIGSSASDECNVMSIDQAGQTTPSTPADCWN